MHKFSRSLRPVPPFPSNYPSVASKTLAMAPANSSPFKQLTSFSQSQLIIRTREPAPAAVVAADKHNEKKKRKCVHATWRFSPMCGARNFQHCWRCSLCCCSVEIPVIAMFQDGLSKGQGPSYCGTCLCKVTRVGLRSTTLFYEQAISSHFFYFSFHFL